MQVYSTGVGKYYVSPVGTWEVITGVGLGLGLLSRANVVCTHTLQHS